MLGDDAPTHIDLEAVKLCVENDIRFVLLPPNATHLLQPCDVSVFGPLKPQWRKTLGEWKKTHRGVLPKAEFPRTLKAALDACGSRMPANVVAGFKACGIFPFDPQAVLKRIPHRQEEDEDSDRERSWTDAFVGHLAAARCPTSSGDSSRPPRQKKLNVSPRKSVTPGGFRRRTDSTDEENHSENQSREAETTVDDPAPAAGSGSLDDTNEEFSNTPIAAGDIVLSKLVSDAGAEKFYLGNVEKVLRNRGLRVPFLQGGRRSWKTWKSGKSQGISSVWKSRGKVRENDEKIRKVREKQTKN